MSKNSNIAWTDHSWNPVTGCTQVSPGCDNCYALRIAERFRGGKAWPDGFGVTLRPHRLDEPLRWREPARIFVNSMSDLFHRDIPDEYLRQVWDVMLRADHHQYQVLTKRAHRMAHKVRTLGLELEPHIWLGVSAENQAMADNRIPPLLELPAAIRWVSCEPLLGSVDLSRYIDRLQWAVAGGESGSGRRPMEYEWARDLRDQCEAAGVEFFYKQGNSFRPGGDDELDGRVYQQMPGRFTGNGTLGLSRFRRTDRDGKVKK